MAIPSNTITIRISKDTYKALQQLKLDMDSKSVSDVISTLVAKGK